MALKTGLMRMRKADLVSLSLELGSLEDPPANSFKREHVEHIIDLITVPHHQPPHEPTNTTHQHPSALRAEVAAARGAPGLLLLFFEFFFKNIFEKIRNIV